MEAERRGRERRERGGEREREAEGGKERQGHEVHTSNFSSPWDVESAGFSNVVTSVVYFPGATNLVLHVRVVVAGHLHEFVEVVDEERDIEDPLDLPLGVEEWPLLRHSLQRELYTDSVPLRVFTLVTCMSKN